MPPTTTSARRAHDADARRERGVRAVTALTAVTMVVEIAAGYWNGSMALLADGWHMATHVGALGLAGLAYVLARRLAGHEAFVFGAGKIPALAGFASSLLLGGVAISVVVDAVRRLATPREVDWDAALPVAVIGLAVNLVSVWMLHRDAHDHDHDHDHDHEHEHEHEHEDDPIHRSALLHVLADALTSALAIAAILAGRYLGWGWLDPLTAVVGALVILQWSGSLLRSTSLTLLDVDAERGLSRRVQAAIGEGATIEALHAWRTGRGSQACMVRVVVRTESEGRDIEARLGRLGLSPLVVQVRVAPER